MMPADRMKRTGIFIFILCTAVALCLCGCGRNAGSASSSTVAAEDADAPVTAEGVRDGTYGIEAESDRGSFAVEMCSLSVRDGKMIAALTVKGGDYLYLFMGMPNDAVTDGPDSARAIAGKDTSTFLIPVEALDTDLSCALLTGKTQKWLPVTLCFRSASLPAGALKNGNMKTIAELGLSDGEYTVGAELSGGSGKASVVSPAALSVSEGKAEVRVEFSSPYFDYVLLDGTKYKPVSSSGNSVFELPADGLDYEMPITADTTAMSQAHEIQYTLYFDSTTIRQVFDGEQQ